MAILMVIKTNILRIYIHNDYQVVVNIINGTIAVLQYIINLVEDITCLLSYIKKNRMEYYSKTINRDIDAITTMTHM